VTSDLSCGSRLLVSDDAIVAGDISVTGNGFMLGGTSIGANAAVEGSISIRRSMVTEQCSVSDNLIVGSLLLCLGSINVTDVVYMEGDVNCGSSLHVDGPSVARNSVEVVGLVVGYSSLSIVDVANVGSDLSVAGNGCFNGSFRVGGTASIMNQSRFGSDLTADGGVSARSAIVEDHLSVTGLSVMHSGCSIYGHGDLDGSLSVSDGITTGLFSAIYDCAVGRTISALGGVNIVGQLSVANDTYVEYDPNIHFITYVYDKPDTYQPSLLTLFENQKLSRSFLTGKIVVE
jgi:hypothetical protein